MKRQSDVRAKVVEILSTMAEAGVELFHTRDVAEWGGIPENSTLSTMLAQLAKEHQIVVTRYSELNGVRGKIYAFNETRYSANMREGAR